MNRYFAALLITPLLLLSGCASRPTTGLQTTSTFEWEEQTTAAQQLQRWEFSGRAAIRSLQESGTVSLDWQQEGDDYVLHISGAFGVGNTRIVGKPRIVMVTANGQTMVGRSPEQMILELTGLEIPVKPMRYWVLGAPSPESDFQAMYQPSGELAILEQDGWKVEYPQARCQEGDYLLPTRIKLSRDNLSITLIISDWVIDA